MDNQTASRDEDVITFETFAGVRNDVAPERFTPADLFLANNVDLDRTGRLARRAGYTLRSAGTAHSVWADDTEIQCLLARGGQLQQLNADYSVTPLAALTAPNEPVSYAKVNDSVYFANGVDTGVVEQGAVRSWGIVPPVLPGVTPTVGDMPAGTYQFTATYFRESGQESGAPLSGVIELPVSSGLDFTMPVSNDPGVSSKALYLSQPNGEKLYLAQLVPNSQIDVAYTNDTGELTLPLDCQFLSAAPAGQLIAYYRGVMFVAVGDVIYPSEPFDYERFDLRKYIPCAGRVTLLASMTDKELTDAGRSSGFFIGTDRSCGVLVGSSPADFQYIPKTDYGAIPGAVDSVDAALFDASLTTRALPMWLTTQGVCVGMPDMSVQNLTRTKFGSSADTPGAAVLQAAGKGAAIFMPGPNRFVVTCNF